MERKFIYFCPKCKKYRVVKPNQPDRFFCIMCGNKMIYKGAEEGEKMEILKKISETNTQKEQPEKKSQQASYSEENIPRCPTCHSTKIKKIGAFERMASVGFWGPFSKKINKTFKCENCGYTW